LSDALVPDRRSLERASSRSAHLRAQFTGCTIWDLGFQAGIAFGLVQRLTEQIDSRTTLSGGQVFFVLRVLATMTISEPKAQAGLRGVNTNS
jgi:hypothetical protein